MGTYLKAAERHLPYGITHCYLPPDTGERVCLNFSPTGWHSIYPYFLFALAPIELEMLILKLAWSFCLLNCKRVNLVISV